jgi:hypothetical protein
MLFSSHGLRTLLCLLVAIIFGLASALSPGMEVYPRRCSSHYKDASVGSNKAVVGCTPKEGGKCDRVVQSDFLGKEEVDTLIEMAEKGMAKVPRRSQRRAGPTIMDVNSGYVLGSGEHQPAGIYRDGQIYSPKQYETYRRVTTKIKGFIEEYFELSKLYFTAPTFITREIGDPSWKPKTMHDEYWHVHVDKNNTDHYDYSGLIYLSDHGVDFEGGELEFYEYDALNCDPFVDEKNPGPCIVLGEPSQTVTPARGRLIVFGSGRENPHRVKKVSTGTRYVLSFWFTCNGQREFGTFLDGKNHKNYKGKRKHRKKRTKEEL